MSTKSKSLRDMLVVGFAMFAVFFGAGNLIFPPQVGFDAGAHWPMAMLGLSLTGMLLPVLAVVAVVKNGGSFESLSRPIAPWFGTALIAITMIAIAWLITIPRTASVAYETGLLSLLPGIDPQLSLYIFVPVYFIISLYFAIDKSNVVDKLGRVLTPCLLLILAVIVVWAVVKPLGEPAERALLAPFHMGFVTGYQTGDVFTGLLFAVLFIEGLRDKGYTAERGLTAMTVGISAVTFVGLLFVYGGLEYLGATGSGIMLPEEVQSGLLTALVSALAGQVGAAILGLAVILACLTTAVGATAVMAQYLTKWSRGYISYRAAVLITTIVATFQAFGGVAYIITIAGPIFMLFYPVGIAIVILGLLPSRLTNVGTWRGAAVMTMLIGAYDSVHLLFAILGLSMPTALADAYAMIPLADQGFGWIVPGVCGALIGGVFCKLSNNAHHSTYESPVRK